MSSVKQIRADVQQEFERALAIAEGDPTRRLLEVEGALWTALLALGRALLALYLARVVGRPRAAQYQHGGRSYSLASMRLLEVGTRFGKIAFDRPVGVAEGGSGGGRDFPVDRELGLSAGFSLGVVAEVGKLAAQMAWCRSRAFLDVYECRQGAGPQRPPSAGSMGSRPEATAPRREARRSPRAAPGAGGET